MCEPALFKLLQSINTFHDLYALIVQDKFSEIDEVLHEIHSTNIIKTKVELSEILSIVFLDIQEVTL